MSGDDTPADVIVGNGQKANNRARTCQRTKREKVQVKARGERCVPTQEVLMSRPMEAERGSRGGE